MSTTLSRQTFLRAFLLQLVVPFYLLCDSVYAIECKSGGREEKVLAWLCAIWILLGLGAWLLARDRFVERTSNVVFGMYVTLFLLCLLEVGVRINARFFDHRVLFFKSNTKQVYDLTPWYMPGTSPHITLTTNSMGLRGPG